MICLRAYVLLCQSDKYEILGKGCFPVHHRVKIGLKLENLLALRRLRMISQSSKSIFGIVWPWTLTSWPPKLVVSYPCPVDACHVPIVYKFGRKWTDARMITRTGLKHYAPPACYGGRTKTKCTGLSTTKPHDHTFIRFESIPDGVTGGFGIIKRLALL